MVAAAVLLAGVLSSLLVLYHFRAREYDRLLGDLERASHDRVTALAKTLELDRLAMESVRSFYVGSNEVDRREFHVFVTPLLTDHPSIRALQWAPRVPDSRKSEYEIAAARDGYARFRVTESGAQGSFAPAARRDEYFPIFFVEPSEGVVATLGFDLATDPTCREAMDRSHDTAQLVATSRMVIPEETGDEPGVRVFLPIYRKDVSLQTVEERRKNLEGFVVGVLRISGIVEESFAALAPAGIDIWILDGPVLPSGKPLYFFTSRTHGSDAAASDEEQMRGQSGLRFTTTLDVGERRWTIVCAAAPAFVAARVTWQPWIIAGCGLLLTGLLAAYLIDILARNARTAQLAERLAAANRQLTCEIGDREQAEDASRRENAKLSAIISGMEEGVVFADADNVIVEINEFLCRFVGKQRSEILGKRIEDLHGGEPLRNILSQIGRFREELGSATFVLQRPLGDKEVVMRMQPIYRGGNYDGVLLNVIDVSELVEARREAEVASTAKSRFLAAMSHEIRSPMTAILGYTDLLMDPSLGPSNRDNYLAVIRRNGEHLLQLINDILDLSKIEAGKMSLDMRRCSLVSVLADVASMMRPRAEQRRDTLSIQYAGELPESIYTDGARLRQALVNLVGNAVKFTENGSVRILVSLLPAWRGGEPAVRIEVVDTGIGIRDDVLPQLFQPFNQGDAEVARKFGGTGLGLAISRRIAELLGGELTASSILGQGSSFTLLVPAGDLQGIRILPRPAEALAESAADAAIAPPGDLTGIRILLAEDGFDNQQLIGTVLRKAGALVEVAENGRIAVDKAGAESFDVILMDMNMPEMDGYQATRTLRDRGCERPILALTANAMSDDGDRSRAAGCNDHLTKPIDRPRLIRTIAAYVGKTPSTAAAAPFAAAQAAIGEDGALVSQFADDPEIAPILDGFVARLEGQVGEMRQALSSRAHQELQRLAHKLKGSGGNYGYPSLTEASGALEDAARARNVEAAAAAVRRVALLCEAIQRGRLSSASVGRST